MSASHILYSTTILVVSVHRNKEIARQFVAEPTAGHTGRHFEEIGNNAFVEPEDSLLTDNQGNGIPYRLVLIAHPGHGVYLKPSTEDITRTVSTRNKTLVSITTYNGYVQVCATAPDMAPAASLRTAGGFLSPSGVRYFLTDS